MKICKNDLDIILYSVTRCSQCALRTRKSPCLWLRVVGMQDSLECGGITKDTISDIFKL